MTNQERNPPRIRLINPGEEQWATVSGFVTFLCATTKSSTLIRKTPEQFEDLPHKQFADYKRISFINRGWTLAATTPATLLRVINNAAWLASGSKPVGEPPVHLLAPKSDTSTLRYS